MDAAYDRKKARAAAISALASRAGREIGAIPPVKNPARRIAAAKSYRKFCESYFAHQFALAWSADHLIVIARIEQAVMRGGKFALAMPRGSGKTTLCEIAVLWAALNGFASFAVLIGSDEASAAEMIESIQRELSANDLLLEDYPEAVFPIRRLEGVAHRANAQLCGGELTHLVWAGNTIVLPTIRGSQASGAIIRVAGLTGRLRGMKFKRPDGRAVRPDLVILDDPQTDESARSAAQCATRMRIITGAVMGLAGPGKPIAAVMPCTVIAPDDVADRILDRQKHPQWNGQRTKMLTSMPTNLALWRKYAEIRGDSLRAGNFGAEATEFYGAHRDEMDAGAHAAWPQRHRPGELSAVQHAMNLWIDDEHSFAAEYQNDPRPEIDGDQNGMTVEEIRRKTNAANRFIVPHGMDELTAFIDVQGELLYYLIAAWGGGFSGAVIDYGSFPDQRRDYFTLADARNTLSLQFSAAGDEGRIYAGLDALTRGILARAYVRDDGAEMRIRRCLIDANWGKSTDTVYQLCRQSPHASILMPAHGRFVGASSIPWDRYQRRPGELLGHHWLVPAVKNTRSVRHVIFDVNYWKSFIQSRLRTAPADPGCLSLWGSIEQRTNHRMLAEHCTAEYGVTTVGRGRTVTEWKIKPGRPDNHLWDCLVGAAAAASMLGVQLGILAQKKTAPRRSYRRVAYL